MAEGTVSPHSVLEKYEFYFLGLTFTLLGASIQTANLTAHSSISIVAEIVGWLSLVTSGLVGLSKIEYLPVLIHLRNRKSEFEKYKSTLEQARTSGATEVRVAETGDVVTVGEVLLKIENNVSQYTSQLGTVGKWHEAKHITQKWSFVAGLLFVAVARAYDAVSHIIFS
jgi:hypothetical protein